MRHVGQLKERIRRLEVRVFVACPFCGAAAGENCVKVRGGKRYASHSERWAAYRELGMPKATNA